MINGKQYNIMHGLLLLSRWKFTWWVSESWTLIRYCRYWDVTPDNGWKQFCFSCFNGFVDFILCMTSDYDISYMFLNLIYHSPKQSSFSENTMLFAYVSKVHIILCLNLSQSLWCPNFSNLAATVLISFSPSQIFLSRQLQPNWPL